MPQISEGILIILMLSTDEDVCDAQVDNTTLVTREDSSDGAVYCYARALI